VGRVYLDNNATTFPLPEVAEAVARALRLGGNPSSAHASGRAARALLADSRDAVAALLGVPPSEVVFTSGGTEANNLAVIGGARAAVEEGLSPHVVISSVEHPAVDEAAARLAREGFRVDRASPERASGGPDPPVEGRVTDRTALVAVMLLQNETGALHEVREIFAAVRARAPRARLHVDAVQALGKVRFSPQDLHADTVAVSAHKVHGPKGIGALWSRAGREPFPRSHGGSQERGLRTGTENVPGAAGFAAAAAAFGARGAEWRERVARVGAILEDGLLALPGARLNSPPRPRRHAGTLNVSFDGVRGDLLLMALDGEGVDVSTGSACASGAPVPSRVLRALGLSEERARGAVRFSAGALTTEDEARAAVDAVRRLLPRLADAAIR